jgi:hypothetical protein
MSADFLLMVVGVLTSLLFMYVPTLKARLDEQTPEVKRLVMLGLMAMAALASLGLACVGLAADFGIPLTGPGLSN